MKKVLTKEPRKLYGDASGLRGNVDGLSGDVTGLRGDVDGLRGNVDEAGMTPVERSGGVALRDLVIV